MNDLVKGLVEGGSWLLIAFVSLKALDSAMREERRRDVASTLWYGLEDRVAARFMWRVERGFEAVFGAKHLSWRVTAARAPS